ncbi:MAG TPA: SMP-30/gluconolactonase/LRE family protein [Burkholderiales bacterium]|nr:SMP-30/gluconolactonase/LRE family protein [Burkholderiales bacterium]
MNASEPQVLIASRNLVGESPLWRPAESALYWVDVEGRSLHRWHEPDGALHQWRLDEPVGCIGLRKSGGLVGACRSGFFFFDTSSGTATALCDPEQDRPENRFNDGKVDRQGRFWAGTRNFVDTTRASGCLYRLDADHSVHRMEEGLRCPNGIAWSPDNRRMYLCDTWIRRIYVYDFDAASGAVANRRLFVELPASQGFPDGLTVDSQGYVWNAHYNGWRITRYAPDGSVDLVLPMPVRDVTSLTFGRADAQTLFVTTSHLRLPPGERQRQSTAGHVYALRAPAPGLPEPEFLG